jgi:hypothetical protein
MMQMRRCGSRRTSIIDGSIIGCRVIIMIMGLDITIATVTVTGVGVKYASLQVTSTNSLTSTCMSLQ